MKVLSLIDELLESDDPGLKPGDPSDEDYRMSLIMDIGEELRSHFSTEERIVYKRLEARQVSLPLVRASYREHREAEALLLELQNQAESDGKWRDVAEKLREHLAHHIRIEETQLFPKEDFLTSPNVSQKNT